MSLSEPPPSTGLIAGKYELLGMIGRGGMGSVWEGRHASLGTKVAIKFIEAEYANSQEARSRFDTEARAAATIQSKHAIQIYDHGVTHDGKPYIVMEMLVGEPLDKRIDRVGRLTLQDTARILQQVCRGLQRAHERGIVHRDLKPENIFLVRTEEDDEEVAKVLDFGIAKIKSADGMGISSSTKTGAVLGTPFFMSPEQARGLRAVDHRSDVWSIGVIAFKCVTGVLPFDGESVGDLLVKICTAPPPIPSQLVPGLPPAFDAWFARALDREPQRRFASAQELSDALAYTAGVSVRRPVSSQSTPEPPVGSYQATMQADSGMGMHGRPISPNHTPAVQTASSPQYPGHPAAQATATSAPFTQSTPAGVPRSGRGTVVAVSLIAFLVVGGASAIGVTRFLAGRSHDTANGATSNLGTKASGAGVTPSAAVAVGGGSHEVPVVPSASAATSPTPIVPALVTASAAPIAQNTKPPKRPSTPAPQITKPPVGPAPVTPVTTPPKPPVVPPPPRPTVVDPGY